MYNNYPITRSFSGIGGMITENTVNRMKRAIIESSNNLRIRNKAADIVYSCPPKDWYCEASTIYDWVRANTRYLRDMENTELIFSPLVALDIIESGKQFQGDCDDLSVLTLSLLKSIGFPVALRIGDYGKGYFQHVYGLVKIKGIWTPIEPIKLGVPLGWQAPNAVRIQDYRVED